ncbi:MAG TPA: type IV secretion system protein [Streptosporangiaceae bacterium]|nr:type IV secretion system protein [Streptosporangiaceae bacterium]
MPGIGDIGGLVGLCAAGSSGIIGDLNNICQPSVPQPEQATGGLNSMIEPPQSAAGGKTLYDNYGVAGQYWAAHDMQCSDMTSLVGNNVAGMVFDAAKAMDRVTITVYQSAAGDNILTWLRNAVDRLISALGNAIYFPYLAPVVLLGAVWLAWQGLVRKRATRTIEGTLWMVVAATAAIALIGKPADFTGVGSTVSNGVTQVLNTAFAKLPSPGGSDCLPVQAGDRQSVTANYNFASGNGLVDQNADELWSVLVCKPWLYGELGTTQFATTGNGPQTVVNQYGRQLIWAQAIASNETPSTALITAKQDTYSGIAAQIKANNPGIYPLFQGNQWTTRLEIAFAAIFAALVAGLLILLIALTLIVLKLGFLLLLVAGPFFLIIGTHPGFGRIIAIRWFEMLVGVLMKQVAIAMVLSVLLYCYSLIMGTADTVLPWALKILMIALVTVTVFIYRKPFQHLFSAVGYGTIGSQERSDISLREASDSFRRSTVSAASVIPGYRAARWARRNPGQAAALAAGTVAAGVGAAAGAAAAAAGARGGTEQGAESAGTTAGAAYAGRLRADSPPASDGEGDGSGQNGGRPALGGGGSARTRAATEAADASGRTAPPLELPARGGTGSSRWPGTRTGRSGSSGPVGSASGGVSGTSGLAGGSGGFAGSGSGGLAGGAGGLVRSGSGGLAGGGSGSGGSGGLAGGGSGSGGLAGGGGGRSGGFFGGGRSGGGRSGAGSGGGSGSGGSGSGGSSSSGSGGGSGSGGSGSGLFGGGSGAAASGWSRGAGRAAARSRSGSSPSRGAAPPLSGGGGSGPAPWPGSGPARSGGGLSGQEATPSDGQPSGTSTDGGEKAMPFWLRPIKRDK